MKQVSVIDFLALIASPALHAELLSLVKGERRFHRLAQFGAVAALVIACWVSFEFVRDPDAGSLLASLPVSRGHALHFGVDALSAPLLPLLTLLTLAVVMAGPRALLKRRELRALLWLESLSLLTLTTMDLAVLAVGWTLVLVPTYRLTLRAEGPARAVLSRVFIVYHLAGVFCFITAVCALGAWAHPSGFLDMSLLHLDAAVVPERYRLLLFALLSTAALVRMGVFPFHSWLPATFEHGSVLAIVILVSMRTGLYLLARVALPAFPEAAREALPVLVTIALISAFYGALGALGQRDLRRMVGFFVVSQSGIMLTGFALGDTHALSGALLYWIGFAIATTGMTLMLTALRARTGTTHMDAFGGIVADAPLLSGAFFLFGLATIAIPGSVAFPAEDMLVHGALELHPWLTAVMIIAMVLNAITLVRAFAHTFLGERPASRPSGTLVDLERRELVTVASLIIVLFVAGIAPGPIVDIQTRAARDIARLEGAATQTTPHHP